MPITYASLAPHPLHGRVEERLLGHRGAVALAEVLYLDLCTLLREPRRQPSVGDALPDRIPIGRAGHVANRPAPGVDRLAAHHDYPWIVEEEARELATRACLRTPQERLPADEVALVGLHRETQTCLVGVVLGRHVRPPRPVALLQSETVERPAPGGDRAERPSCLVEQVPESQAQVGGGVDLPPELADVGDPQSYDWHLAYVELSGFEEPERLVREIVGAQRLHELACLRSPHPDAACATAYVPDLHRAVIGQVTPHPLDVPRPVEPELEVVLLETSDGYIALDAAGLVKHERVGDAADGLV